MFSDLASETDKYRRNNKLSPIWLIQVYFLVPFIARWDIYHHLLTANYGVQWESSGHAIAETLYEIYQAYESTYGHRFTLQYQTDINKAESKTSIWDYESNVVASTIENMSREYREGIENYIRIRA